MAVNQIRRNGSYAPLSVNYYKDDAIAHAGEKAEVLFTRGLAFSAEVLSDGFISDIQLTRFVGAGLTQVQARARKLCEVGVWSRDEERGGYWIKSWPKWNLSREEIQAKAQKDAARKSKGSP